jgi:ABC-type branched-subunit amino acid transport system ATPase component
MTRKREARRRSAEYQGDRLLELHDVCCAFGGVKAVAGVSFDVSPGETVGLIGPNGAGKTTLLNCIAGGQKPTSGSIVLRGRDVTGSQPYRVARSGTIRTFQRSGEFPRLTVLENLLMGALDQRGETLIGAFRGARYWGAQEYALIRRAQTLLEECSLLDMQDAYLEELSGGQRRIVEILRALMAKPALLLLDEPFAGINRTMTRHLEEYLVSVRTQGIGILLVEHELGPVERLCSRVFVMVQGQVISEGTMAELRVRKEVQEAYLAG